MLVATRSLLSRIHFKSMAAFHWGLGVAFSPWDEALEAGSDIAGDEMARRREGRETLSQMTGRVGVRVLKSGRCDGSLQTTGASDNKQVHEIIPE